MASSINDPFVHFVTLKLRVTGLALWWSPVNSPNRGPVTRNMFPFDDIIMKFRMICVTINVGRTYKITEIQMDRKGENNARFRLTGAGNYLKSFRNYEYCYFHMENKNINIVRLLVTVQSSVHAASLQLSTSAHKINVTERIFFKIHQFPLKQISEMRRDVRLKTGLWTFKALDKVTPTLLLAVHTILVVQVNGNVMHYQ